MKDFSWPEVLIAIYILWDIVKTFFKEKNSDLKDNTRAHRENTVAIKLLEQRLDSFQTRHARSPDDINNLGLLIRGMDERLKFLEKHSDS